LHCNDDSAILFEPLPDARQALPIGNRSLDLGPKGANLASFGRGLFPAPLCEAVSGFGDPLLFRFRVLFALDHLFDSLRLISTYFNIFRQFMMSSTIFDVFRQREAREIAPRPVRRPKTLVVEHKVGMRRWGFSWCLCCSSCGSGGMRFSGPASRLVCAFGFAIISVPNRLRHPLTGERRSQHGPTSNPIF
jgi:hypothetical protein